jgi:hypothetical protein
MATTPEVYKYAQCKQTNDCNRGFFCTAVFNYELIQKGKKKHKCHKPEIYAKVN